MRPERRREGLVVSAVGEETLVYDLERDRAHALEPRAAAVWRACDGRRTPPDIARLAGVDEAAVRLVLDRLSRAAGLAVQLDR